MKALTLTAAIALATIAGCAAPGGTTSAGYGFPIDEKCMEFYGNDPFYKGNKQLAYATNCAHGSM
jgi:hypothetical protein